MKKYIKPKLLKNQFKHSAFFLDHYAVCNFLVNLAGGRVGAVFVVVDKRILTDCDREIEVYSLENPLKNIKLSGNGT